MYLSEMRTKFKQRVGGLALDETDAGVDVYMNRWYQFLIPADIGGDLAEGVWVQETSFLVDEYEYPSYVIAPRADSAYIKTRKVDFDTDPTISEIGPFFLDTETDRSVFEYSDRYHPTSTTGGIPTVALFAERKMTISPAPDEAYFISVPCLMGPSVALGTGAGELDGLTNEIHAMTVITGAAYEFLTDSEDTEGASREGTSYEFYKSQLHKYAHGKPRHRRPARSF